MAEVDQNIGEHGADQMENHGVNLDVDHGLDPAVNHGLDHSLNHGVDHAVDHDVDHGLDHPIEQGLDHAVDEGLDHDTDHGVVVEHNVEHVIDQDVEHGVDQNVDQAIEHNIDHTADPVPENFQVQEEQGQDEDTVAGGSEKKWPGWPGESVFRMLVPAQKVGSIIGRKGEFIKKIVEETRARIKILDGPPATTERAVLSANFKGINHH